MAGVNGALIVANRHARLQLAVHSANEAAEAETRRHEDEATDKLASKKLADQLHDRLHQAARAKQKYGEALKVIRHLHAQQLADAHEMDATAGEQLVREALTKEQISAHRQAMIDALRPFFSGSTEVERGVDADIRRIVSEVQAEQEPSGFDPQRD